MISNKRKNNIQMYKVVLFLGLIICIIKASYTPLEGNSMKSFVRGKGT